MSSDRCVQCEQHAEIHSRNFGFDNRPCKQCEEHVVLHGNDGCGGVFMVATVTIAAVAGVLRLARNRT